MLSGMLNPIQRDCNCRVFILTYRCVSVVIVKPFINFNDVLLFVHASHVLRCWLLHIIGMILLLIYR